jgi:hypothetical protein
VGRRGQALHAVVVGEEGLQLVGQLGVAAEELVAIRRPAGGFRFQVLGEERIHALLV